jgi:hypothetical protein
MTGPDEVQLAWRDALTRSTKPAVRAVSAMTEKDLTRAVADLARLFGWERYHTHRSDFSPAGWPDEVLCRPPRLVIAELKSDKGKPSEAQVRWLDLLSHVETVEPYLWRPDDLEQIAQILR